MTQDKQDEIKRLAIEFNTAQWNYQAEQIRNQPIDPKEREQAMIAFHLARAEAIEAKARLDAAVQSCGQLQQDAP